MKYILLALICLLLATSSQAKIYKWVDENGRLHFSDKPYSNDAEEVKIKGTRIKVDGIPNQAKTQKNNEPAASDVADKTVSGQHNKKENKPITEADYRITSSVGKLGADALSISGRISSGPKCDNMTVTATARSDKGQSATIKDQIRKPNSFGSTIFEGTTKVHGSGDDYSTWKVESIKISCND